MRHWSDTNYPSTTKILPFDRSVYRSRIYFIGTLIVPLLLVTLFCDHQELQGIKKENVQDSMYRYSLTSQVNRNLPFFFLKFLFFYTDLNVKGSSFLVPVRTEVRSSEPGTKVRNFFNNPFLSLIYNLVYCRGDVLTYR